MGALILFAWYILTIVQSFLAYGTAYRYTKNGGDNGASLFGWLFLLQLAALIPGLGIYLWKSSLESERYVPTYSSSSTRPQPYLNQERKDNTPIFKDHIDN